jgi:5-oxoprolinase (ATP-hydrolysing)
VSHWKISADTGGTFTDCIVEGPMGFVRSGKVLSSGRLRTIVKGILEDGSVAIEPLPLKDLSWLKGQPVWIGTEPAGIIHGASPGRLLLDRRLGGFGGGDILEIDSGMEAPVLAMKLLAPEASSLDQAVSFRLGTTKGTNALLEKKGAPVALFLTQGFKDLLVIRDQKRPDLFEKAIFREPPLYHRVYEVPGRLDTSGHEDLPLDIEQLAEAGKKALVAGCEVAAVCFLNSWRNPAHEDEAVEVLCAVGFERVVASSGIRPLIKYLDRAETALVNATLSPVMDAYLDQVGEGIHGNPLWVMTSAGGLVSRERFHAVDSLVSGPAGGVLGAVEAGRRAGMEKIIGLDMGGTSTDVSRWRERVELRQQVQVGQARILTPAMPIETVAAGGGSICGFRDGRLFVGPESAGADPGPASYGAGGPLCLTDIHLLLGRIDPEAFSIPICLADARARLDEVMAAAGEDDWKALAEGFLSIATERMAQATRQVTLREGEDPSGYGIVAFGGAGGLHACRVAQSLEIRRVLYPSEAGILSARGIHHAPREAVFERQLFREVGEQNKGLGDAFDQLFGQAEAALLREGVSPDALADPLRTDYMRIKGQESGIPVPWSPGSDMRSEFKERFVAIFGYYPKDPSLEIIKLRLRLLEKTPSSRPETFSGKVLQGPCIISNAFGTCFVEEGWRATEGDRGSYQLELDQRAGGTPGALLENVRKTLVMNRLEGLVEEMGDQLQRTALSTNIRERLDFSCALLDNRGRLLINAPHIPVHLGALGLCVRQCLEHFNLGPGDVLVTNHPGFGGSHLPDVTLICGLFDEEGACLGYLANRAHHAELGGKSPGSMPPDAGSLMEEGIVIEPQLLVHGQDDHFDRIEDLLSGGAFPSRSVRENRIDLEAQLASLQRGKILFGELLGDFERVEIERHFHSFYESAAASLSSALKDAGMISGKAVEALDDGHSVHVRVEGQGEGLCIAFSGTSPLHPGNLNATPAIVRSAVLYVLRLLVGTSMPLNEGLLDKVEIRLPKCFLNPPFPEDPACCPAVVGGNVETSQRIVDALIRALGLMAASQGTMNNFLFGNERFGYYETIGGGSGAGEGFPGASGVHVHMTNTAITDPEILEQRFPVECREFSLRSGSAGAGKFPGGDGLIREIRFKDAVTVSLLTQNRVRGAQGLNGGGNGQPGRQWHVLKDGELRSLEGICQVKVQPGEGIRIETPGGGGWGK